MIFFKRLFCKHEYEFVRNVYGDEIIIWDWNRSLWACKHCGRREAHPEVHETSHINVDIGVQE